jgi:hypothetical protein
MFFEKKITPYCESRENYVSILCAKKKNIELFNVKRRVENSYHCSGSPSVLRGHLEDREVWLGEHRD